MQRIVLALFAVTLALPCAVATAQREKQGLPVWDPNTVRTVKMTVVGITSGRRADVVFLKVKDATGEHLLMLGPKATVDPGLMRIPASTEVEVTASVVKRGKRDRRLFLASVVKVHDKVYRIRDDQGRLVDKNGQPIAPSQ
jgi:hypothetical protein